YLVIAYTKVLFLTLVSSLIYLSISVFVPFFTKAHTSSVEQIGASPYVVCANTDEAVANSIISRIDNERRNPCIMPTANPSTAPIRSKDWYTYSLESKKELT